MRAHEILGELAGVKAAVGAPKTTTDAKAVLQRFGFEFVAGGEYSLVFQNENMPDQVVKLYNDPIYESFIQIARAHPENPHLPKFKGPSVKVNSDPPARMIRIEKLAPLTSDEKSLITSLRGLAKRTVAGLTDEMWELEPEAQSLLDTMMMLIKAMPKDARFDLHTSNAMKRPSTGDIVIIDPFQQADSLQGWASGRYSR